MHPLIITPLFPPAVGGAATYFGQMAPLLAARPGVTRLTLLTERAAGRPEREETGNLVILRQLPPRISIPARPWLWHAASFVQTQAWFARHLPALVQAEGVDLIHFHTRYRGRLFFDALVRSRVSVVADLRDKLSDPVALARVSRLLMCCCEGVRAFALAGGYPADRVRLIPMAFTPPRPPEQALLDQVQQDYHIGDAPYLLYLGDINASKGVPELLPAFAQWRARHPDVQLLLAGMNRLGGRFLQQLMDIPGARYLGSVSHQQAIALIAAAEIVLLPSRSEGLPRVILEALTLNRRVLAPPGIPEFDRAIPDYVLPEVTTPAIAAALDRIWASPPPPSFPLDAYRFDRIVPQILDVYRELSTHTSSSPLIPT